MHDIDRTQLESGALESDVHESAEMAPEFFETAESPLSEEQEIELASELLEVASDQHLEQFLGNLIGKVGSAVGQFAGSDTGRALGGILKDAARQALPVVGRAVGQWVSPDSGGTIGADLANQAGRVLGLELEGLSPEDKEFEVARQFVRFASAAAKRACMTPPTAEPLMTARNAALAAARTYAPGLAPRLQGRSSLLWPRSGRWIRRGKTIVLFGG
jgi:hypothetical protein